MDLTLDTRTLILLIHAVIAGAVFVYAGLTFSAGETAAGSVRTALGVLVLTLGLALYYVRGKQQGTA